MTLILVRTNLLKIEKMGRLFTILNTALRSRLASTGEAFIPGTRIVSRLKASVSKYSCNVQRLHGTPTACPDQNYSTTLGYLWSSSGEKASVSSCNCPVCFSKKSRPSHRCFAGRGQCLSHLLRDAQTQDEAALWSQTVVSRLHQAVRWSVRARAR